MRKTHTMNCRIDFSFFPYFTMPFESLRQSRVVVRRHYCGELLQQGGEHRRKSFVKAQIVNQSRDDDNINKNVTYFFGINLFPLTFRLLSVSIFTSLIRYFFKTSTQGNLFLCFFWCDEELQGNSMNKTETITESYLQCITVSLAHCIHHIDDEFIFDFVCQM